MARKEGTGGRGGPGVLDTLTMDAFSPVGEEEKITRSRTEPSPLKPFIDAARKNLGQYFEFSDVVPVADEDGNLVQAVHEDGELAWNEDGSPVYATERKPRAYTKEQALELMTELRNAGNRDKLTSRRLSLRILLNPPKDKAPDEGPIRVQFYVIKMGPAGDGNAPE